MKIPSTNIDGAFEKVIHDQLYRMMTYATVNSNSDNDIANFITCDFTGILKGCGIIVSHLNRD